jgi:FkbM family methyltransferase
MEMLQPPVRRVRLLAWKGVESVVDVGANAGQYGTRLRDAGYTGRMVSFEPGSAAFDRLAETARPDPRWEVRRCALGDHDGTVTLNVATDSEGSSLLQVEDREVRNSPGSGFVGTEHVGLSRLDTLWPELRLDASRVYLKLDTQGSELAILHGAERTLRIVEFVEAELSLVPLYRGGPLFDEVIDFLNERGFGLISLEGIDEERDTGHMLQVDAIFLRRA